MTTFGLTPTGFVVKPLEDIVTEIQTDCRAKIAANIDLTPTSNVQSLIAIISDRLEELWQLGQALYVATDSDKALDAALIALCAITGTIPQAARPSTVTAIATGTTGTVLLTGRQPSVVDTKVKFASDADATLVAASAWIALHVYTAGAVVKNSSAIFFCQTGGTSAASGGPSGTSSAITDGTVVWGFVGPGTAFATISWTCTTTGPLTALAGTLTKIETTVAGWLGVRNMVDAALGNEADTNAQLRLRRQQELLGQSRSVIDSIRTRILEDVAGVTSAIVFQNDTESTNVDGMPPHSVECLVRGGLDQDITDTVFANVAAGITTYGNQTGTFVDVDNGEQTYTVKWSRPVLHAIYIIANVVKDPLRFPLDGQARIIASLALAGSFFEEGQDVVSAYLKSFVFNEASVDEETNELDTRPLKGVLNVTSLYVGTAPSPASEATIAMAIRDLADFDSVRITVNLSDGTP